MKWKQKLKYTLAALALFVSLSAAYVAYAAWLNSYTDANEDYANSMLKSVDIKPWQTSLELKVMTYNIANARGFTTNQRERISAVADLLLELDVDIVGLQEVFIEKDRRFLIDQLAHTPLKYAVEFPAGYLGNGLVILSKYPIEEHYFHRFKANNPWWKVWEGDWWAGKGIGLARIRIDKDRYVDFFNVHAQAYRGNQESHDIRYQQYIETSDFLKHASLDNSPVFFVGDFNTEAGMPDYEYVMQHANLVRLMNMDSEIDHITAIKSLFYDFEVLDTEEIYRQIPATHEGKFYSRAPTPMEFWRLHVSETEDGSVTEISDHPGYLSHIKISVNDESSETLSTFTKTTGSM